MSNPNPVNLNNLDGRYAKPADVAAAISAQAVTDAGQYSTKLKWSRFGMNYAPSYPDFTPSTSSYTSDINMRAQMGVRPVQLVFHIGYDNSTLKIAQFGWTNTSNTEALVDAEYAALISAGFTVSTIKVHPYGSPTPSSQFWSDYQTLVLQLATKYQGQGVPRFIVTNEFPAGTGSSTWSSQYSSLISAVKAKGYQVGISALGTDELANCTQISNLDFLGVNIYPNVGVLGLSTTPAHVQGAWERSGIFQMIADYRRMYPTKPFYITETGSTDTLVSFEAPGRSAYATSYAAQNGAILSIYWRGTLNAFIANTPDCDLYAWDAGAFSPYQYVPSLAVMKELIK